MWHSLNIEIIGGLTFFMTEFEHFNISLSSKGLTNIPHQENRNDFAFIVGKKNYFCPWYIAAFLSPKICRHFSNDPTQTEFHVKPQIRTINLLKSFHLVEVKQLLSLHQDYHSLFQLLENLKTMNFRFH
jgi:hypothetical protein